MIHGSLFSGIGGFDLAAQWAGWNNELQVEIDPWCQRILKKNFPDVPYRHDDIRTFDPTPFAGTIDVLSGGFPCQPYSQAGQRKGKDDPRHLWPEMLRIIRTIQPRWVVGENVRGLVNWSGGLVFHEVCADLEFAGYQVQPYILPAASVNAPHQRQRVWFIAHLPHAPHTQSHRCGLCAPAHLRTSTGEIHTPCHTPEICAQQHPPHPASIRRQLTGASRHRRNGLENSSTSPPHNDHERCQKLHTPTLPNQQGRFSGRHVDIWHQWTIEPPVCRMDDGIPHRVDRIRGLGNAVVPQLVWRIFDTINQYEALTTHD